MNGRVCNMPVAVQSRGADDVGGLQQFVARMARCRARRSASARQSGAQCAVRPSVRRTNLTLNIRLMRQLLCGTSRPSDRLCGDSVQPLQVRQVISSRKRCMSPTFAFTTEDQKTYYPDGRHDMLPSVQFQDCVHSPVTVTFINTVKVDGIQAS